MNSISYLPMYSQLCTSVLSILYKLVNSVVLHYTIGVVINNVQVYSIPCTHVFSTMYKLVHYSTLLYFRNGYEQCSSVLSTMYKCTLHQVQACKLQYYIILQDWLRTMYKCTLYHAYMYSLPSTSLYTVLLYYTIGMVMKNV